MSTKNETTYREGTLHIPELVSKISGLDIQEVERKVKEEIPQLADKSKCPHCFASMTEYIFSFNILCGLLLFKMAQEVRSRAEVVNFTEANQVHVPSLNASLAVRCCTTISSKLGLVAKVNYKGSKRQVRGIWCITERGWAALRGEPVPAMVKVFRGKIEERFDKTITMSDLFRVHTDGIQNAIARNRKPRHDYRSDIDQYKESDWFRFAGFNSGKLF